MIDGLAWPALKVPLANGRLLPIGAHTPKGGLYFEPAEAVFVVELIKRFRWGVSTCVGSLDDSRPTLDALMLTDTTRRVRQAVGGQVSEHAAITEERPPPRGPNDLPRRELTARLLVVAGGLPPDPKL